MSCLCKCEGCVIPKKHIFLKIQKESQRLFENIYESIESRDRGGGGHM